MMFATPGLMTSYTDTAVVQINVTGSDFKSICP